MKKTLFAFFVCILASCGGTNKKDPPKGVDITGTKEYQEGLTLVGKNKCLSCHAVNETITGPPYSEIAKKYSSYPDTIVAHLARKVITGGNGVWGEIFMTPHPQVSQEDAEKMVKYVLLLK
jgi:cytochrome c